MHIEQENSKSSRHHWRNNSWRKTLRFRIEEKQFVYGTLLGDTAISLPNKRSKNPRLACNHSTTQEAWVIYKTEKLKRLCPRVDYRDNTGYGEFLVRYTTACLPALAEIDKIVRPRGRKYVTRRWLDLLGSKGIAWWFCDDGSFLRKPFNASFHTEGYDRHENEVIRKWLSDRYGKCNLYRHKRGYYHIRLPRSATVRLFSEIKKHVPSCMQYKLNARA